MSDDSNNSGDAAAAATINGLKVMVIDDSRTIRKSAETMLGKEGCEVVTADDGFEALALIQEHHPDLSRHAGDHADQQGRLVRQGARPDCGFGSLPDETVHQG